MDDENDKLVGLNYKIILNPLVASGDSYRAMVVDPVMIKLIQFNQEVATALDITLEEVEHINSVMCEVASSHLQNGHGVETGMCNFEPTIKGALKESETHITPPKQHVDYIQHLGGNISVDLYSILTHKVEANEKAPIINSVEDGVSETTNDKLTPNGTVIFKGKYLRYDESAEDEGVFFQQGDSITRSSKTYMNTNSEVQVRVPDLAPGEHYRVELRMRFPRKKQLYYEVCESEFTVDSVEVS